MSEQDFKQSLALTLAYEGGYSNNPADPGGPTNQGITQRVYDAYRKLAGLPVQSVKLISSLEVSDIYRKQYWRLIRGDDLPPGVDYAVFDFAVNSGVSRAVRYIQQQIGVEADATIGMHTIAGISAAFQSNPDKLIAQYCANRLAFMRSLSTFPTFGKGWTKRVIGAEPGAQMTDTGVIDYAIKMAHNSVNYKMPAQIAIPAKAIANPEMDNSFPTMTLADATNKNNILMAMIAAS